MKFMAGAAVLAGILVVGGCQQNTGQASNGAANVMSSTATPAPVATASTVVSNLPAECLALLAALQTCSDHLSAANSPVAAQFRLALQQTRETLPAAVSDPGLAAQCAASLKQQNDSAHDLGC